MKYFVLAPAGMISGGPELAHQMCSELVQQRCQASMYYTEVYQREPVDQLAPEPYLRYQTEHERNIEHAQQEDSVVIFNDGTTTYIPEIHAGRKVLWWMSVDNYILTAQETDIDIVREEVDLHLVQSQYAYEYVKNRIGIKEDRILAVSDYINEQYGQFILPAEYRQNIALFNPKKGYEDLEPLIKMTPWLKWIPLINMGVEEIIVIMQGAKVYVDFGGHPGKDRIPREAASCGCCVVTNRKGSAAYEADVPIPLDYKFANVQEQYGEIAELLMDICSRFQEHSSRFDHYRKVIRAEKQQFQEAVKQFVSIVDDKHI